MRPAQPAPCIVSISAYDYVQYRPRFANRLPIMIALAVLMMIGSLTLVLIADRLRRAD